MDFQGVFNRPKELKLPPLPGFLADIKDDIRMPPVLDLQRRYHMMVGVKSHTLGTAGILKGENSRKALFKAAWKASERPRFGKAVERREHGPEFERADRYP